jgi:ADP-ribose pyrophosphatase YjhB (NUDIX family)
MPTIGVFAAIRDLAGRLLFVRQNYGRGYWTTPGGRVEASESIRDALRREVLEETGLEVEAGELVGIYHKLYCDDLVFSLEARVVGGSLQASNNEIAELGYFGLNDIPVPMAFNTRLRCVDALKGARGAIRVFPSETTVA